MQIPPESDGVKHGTEHAIALDVDAAESSETEGDETMAGAAKKTHKLVSRDGDAHRAENQAREELSAVLLQDGVLGGKIRKGTRVGAYDYRETVWSVEVLIAWPIAAPLPRGGHCVVGIAAARDMQIIVPSYVKL